MSKTTELLTVNANKEIVFIKDKLDITTGQFENVLNAYYKRVNINPHPEYHFTFIATLTGVSLDLVEQIFDQQLEFLKSIGLAY